MNRLSTTNLTSGETCMFGNGGTVNNDQYSTWSCTQLRAEHLSTQDLSTNQLVEDLWIWWQHQISHQEKPVFWKWRYCRKCAISSWSSTPIQSLIDNTLNYCWKARTTAPTLASEDFGGMWGMQATTVGVWWGTNYNNPVTGAATCPTWYTTKIGWGLQMLTGFFDGAINNRTPNLSLLSSWFCLEFRRKSLCPNYLWRRKILLCCSEKMSQWMRDMWYLCL